MKELPAPYARCPDRLVSLYKLPVGLAGQLSLACQRLIGVGRRAFRVETAFTDVPATAEITNLVESVGRLFHDACSCFKTEGCVGFSFSAIGVSVPGAWPG